MPLEAALEEVEELPVVRLRLNGAAPASRPRPEQHLRQRFRARLAYLPFGVRQQDRLVAIVEEQMAARRDVQHALVGQAAHFHDEGKLVDFVLTREYRIAGVELCYDAAETPHIDSHRVRNPEDNFRCAVEP